MLTYIFETHVKKFKNKNFILKNNKIINYKHILNSTYNFQ